MVLFIAKNLLFLLACILAVVPHVLAVLNYRSRAETKRRALANLLSDKEILTQYKDRFPSRKSLEDAESIARDYFRTYYSRSEYIASLGLNFLTGTGALIFVLARIGFAPPFVSPGIASFMQNATAGSAVLWALLGSYLWNCYDLIREAASFNLRPDLLTKMWLKMWVSTAVASVLSVGITSALQPAFGFAIGLVSIPALFAAVSDKSSKLLNIKATEGDGSTPIRALQGVTPDQIDQLSEIDIQSTVELAYSDPIHVMMSTNMAWIVIIDLIDQALLFNYIGPDIAKIRSGGYRGSIEVATIGAHLNGSFESRNVGLRSLSNFASLLGWPESKAIDLVQTLYTDSQINLIWDMFGGNYKKRDKRIVPSNYSAAAHTTSKRDQTPATEDFEMSFKRS